MPWLWCSRCRRCDKWHLEWLRSVLITAGGLETTAAAFRTGSATAPPPSLHPIARFCFTEPLSSTVVVFAPSSGVIEHKQLREKRARTIYPTLYRPYRDGTDRGRLVVGE